MTVDHLFTLFGLLISFIIALIAIRQFANNSRYKRLENIQSVWHQFSEKELLKIFLWFEDQRGLPALSDRLRFLALLSEVTILINFSREDLKYGIQLFKWHFHYVFNDHKVRKKFWKGFCPESAIDEEIRIYWSEYKDLADKCSAYLRDTHQIE